VSAKWTGVAKGGGAPLLRPQVETAPQARPNSIVPETVPNVARSMPVPGRVAIDEMRMRVPKGRERAAEGVVREALAIVQREWGGGIDARALGELRLSLGSLDDAGAARSLADRILRSLGGRERGEGVNHA